MLCWGIDNSATGWFYAAGMKHFNLPIYLRLKGQSAFLQVLKRKNLDGISRGQSRLLTLWRWPLRTQILSSEMLLIFSNPVWIYRSGFLNPYYLKRWSLDFSKNDKCSETYWSPYYTWHVCVKFFTCLYKLKKGSVHRLGIWSHYYKRNQAIL